MSRRPPSSRAAEAVAQFHRAFRLPLDEPEASADLRRLRAELVREEAAEVAGAANVVVDVLLHGRGRPADLKPLARELADLIYVVYGAAATLGIDLDLAIERVHASNMSKLGEDGRPVLREDGKVLRGPGFREPDMSGTVYDPVVEAWARPVRRVLQQDAARGWGKAGPPVLLVLARDFRQARAEAERQRLRPLDWRYVSDPERMRGYSRAGVWALPGWYTRWSTKAQAELRWSMSVQDMVYVREDELDPWRRTTPTPTPKTEDAP